MTSTEGRVGILGGTGPEGFGLAVRWANAGLRLAIGSRQLERANEARERILATVPGANVTSETNEAVASEAELVVVAVPMSALEGTLARLGDVLANKLVVSVVAALDWVDGRPRPAIPSEGSAAQVVGRLLPTARVTSALHTLSAEKLGDLTANFDEDSIVCGDQREDRQATMELVRDIGGVRPVSGGRLENSIFAELSVGLLATVNRIHKVHTGLKLAGYEK